MGHFKEHELVIVFPIANTLIVIVHWAVKNAAFLPTESGKLCQDIDQIKKGQSVYIVYTAFLCCYALFLSDTWVNICSVLTWESFFWAKYIPLETTN